MRIRSIDARDVLPVREFQVENLSDVVVLAGPNGVGKTRLIDGILQAFSRPASSSNIGLVIEATSLAERTDWGKDLLDTSVNRDSSLLTRTLQKKRRRADWTSSVIQFESDRSIQKVEPFAFSFDMPDPWEEQISWEMTFRSLKARFQDTQHSIFRKVQSMEKDIATTARALQRDGQRAMALDFSDPLEPFKNAFSQLLAPKTLLDPDPRQQQLLYSFNDMELPISTLSSGEREVVNIVFDFILRNATHSIIFFDEPELHLHPELSYKLLHTLRNVGEANQFFYCTHSPDIITASLEHSVVFLAPPQEPVINQAIVVQENDQTHQALKLLGQSIGVVALGRQLVLIEGDDASLDKQSYGAILKNRFPNFVLVPSGSKDMIRSFSSVRNSVLEHTIWGVEFFMLCDRDAVPSSTSIEEMEAKASGRLKVLPRYHLENYFLDADVLASIFSTMETADSWLRDPRQINNKLRELARSMISYTTALSISARYRLNVGNLDIMPRNSTDRSMSDLTQLILDRADAESDRIKAAMGSDALKAAIQETYDHLQQSVDSETDDWKELIPGKQLLNKFAHHANLNVGRLKTLYLHQAEQHTPYPFDDILSIFQEFNTVSSNNS